MEVLRNPLLPWILFVSLVPSACTAKVASSAQVKAEPFQENEKAGMGDERQEDVRNEVEALLKKLETALSRLKDYTAITTKQEYVDGEMLPMETIFIKQRKTPNSIYMKWIREPYKGRESLFVQGKYYRYHLSKDCMQS